MQNLILVPGLGSDATVWRRTMLQLEGKVNCIVANTVLDDSLHAMAQRVLDNAPHTFALAGVSMGGMVALEMMRIAPSRVMCLALVDTRVRPDTLAQKLYRRLTNVVVATIDYRRLAEYSTRSLVHALAAPDLHAELVEMSLRVGATTYIRQNQAVLARADLRPGLRHIAIPTAVVVGAEDRLTPVNMAEEIHALIPGSTLRILNSCGHLPPIEKPEEMARILLELLRRTA